MDNAGHGVSPRCYDHLSLPAKRTLYNRAEPRDTGINRLDIRSALRPGPDGQHLHPARAGPGHRHRCG